MAKRKSKGGKKQNTVPEKAEERVTLEALEAMSDSDDEDVPESQMNTKAKNLRQAITDGKFDHLLESMKDDDDEEIEEASLHSSDGEDKPVARKGSKKEVEEAVGDSDEEMEDQEEEDEAEQSDEEQAENSGDEEEKESDEESSSDDEEDEKARRLKANNHNNAKALLVVTAELVAVHARLPWAETFDIIPSTPLPFSNKGDPEHNPLDIHDDLKREVAFYNSALEAVNESRTICKQAGIPFSRPDDFFAEMVKNDDHMAKVKDKLIFETKKMGAVAQRKGNREQKLRAKESHANKLMEKSKRKRDHFQQVEEWANSAKQNRGGALQDDADDRYLNRGASKKRETANKKYGFGGKNGRFKQNDRATLNDISGYNPRGNFAGAGTKRTAKSKDGSGANRQGKRARDSNKAGRT